MLATPRFLRASTEKSSVARLRVRPGQPIRAARLGRNSLGLGSNRDGQMSVPFTYHAAKPVPLILMLHGAGGRAGLENYCDAAAKEGIAVAVPDSRGRTWDLLLGGFGPDIAFLEKALALIFASVAVDPRRVAIAGFSDGGSYALSVGLTNGDLFTHVIAYSPGSMSPPAQHGNPSIFISHGIADRILPIETSSRRIVPALKGAGYKVRYEEFDGGHAMSATLVRKSFDWFTAGPSRGS